MHVEKIIVTKENKFGDKYTIEKEQLVYDNNRERLDAQIYNREHLDTYSEHCRKQMDSTIHARISQILDSIDEYFSSINDMY